MLIPFNKIKLFSIRTAVLSAVLIAFCDFAVIKVQLKSSVKINEDSVVIHNPPIAMNVINDSIVGFGITRLDYYLYNYKTGKIVKKIIVDDTLLKRSVSIARNITGKKYERINVNEAKTYGITPYEIWNTYLDRENLCVFFSAMAVLYDSMLYQGKMEHATNYKRIECIGSVNLLDYNMHSIHFLNTYDSLYVSAITGVGKTRNNFYLQNMHEKNHYSVARINRVNDSVFAIADLILPADSIAEVACKSKKLQMITFCNYNNGLVICNGYTFSNAQGKKIYNYNTADPDEKITSFIIDKSKIFFHSKKIANYIVHNKICSYDMLTKKADILTEFDGIASVTFINTNQYLCFIKEGESYLFNTYSIND